jgi:phosphoglucosamine mutase
MLKKQVTEALSSVEKELGKRGRVLLRASGTELLIRVMVEGENNDAITAHAEYLAGVIKAVGET